jgi:hypothetical protein
MGGNGIGYESAYFSEICIENKMLRLHNHVGMRLAIVKSDLSLESMKNPSPYPSPVFAGEGLSFRMKELD